MGRRWNDLEDGEELGMYKEGRRTGWENQKRTRS